MANYLFIYRYPNGMQTIDTLSIAVAYINGAIIFLNAVSTLLWATILVGWLAI